MSFLGKIGIDPKLLLAQVVNFFFLLWILEHYLYKPLLKKLKERANKAKALVDQERMLSKEKLALTQKNQEMIKEAREKVKQILQEGRKISRAEQEKILARVDNESREILARAKERAEILVKEKEKEEEKEILNRTREAIKEVLPTVFSNHLHRLYLQQSISQLEALDWSAIQPETSLVAIASAFPLTEKEYHQIQFLIKKHLKKPKFREKVDPDLLAGFKITISHFILDASLAGKLNEVIKTYGQK